MSDLLLLLPSIRALKAQIDALANLAEIHAAAIAQAAPSRDPKGCPECGAPEEKQAKAPSMGGTTTACLVCGHTRTAAGVPQSIS